MLRAYDCSTDCHLCPYMLAELKGPPDYDTICDRNGSKEILDRDHYDTCAEEGPDLIMILYNPWHWTRE